MTFSIRTIVHPTDFSDPSTEAFVHALRIALATKSSLYILHVATPHDEPDRTAAPQVRHALRQWGLMSEHEPPAAAYDKLGIKVAKIELAPQATVNAILHFLDEHPADLVVLSTEGREGVARWLRGSVAEKVARHTKAPTLFVPAGKRGFVDQARGEVRLHRVLIPVDHIPKPASAVSNIMSFAHLLGGIEVEERVLHVGRNPPQLQRHAAPHHPLPVAVRRGEVVSAILNAASDWQADMIGMATAGHHGFMDALRGSTTERVLRQAPCPVLAVPATV